MEKEYVLDHPYLISPFHWSVLDKASACGSKRVVRHRLRDHDTIHTYTSKWEDETGSAGLGFG